MTDTPRDDDALISALLDGRLDESERAAFWQRIAADPAFADRFAAASLLEADLFEDADLSMIDIAPARIEPDAVSPTLAARFRMTPLAWAVAAAVLVTAGLAVYLAGAGGGDRQATDPEHLIATLVDADTDVIVNDDLANPGGDYVPGVYSIERGSATFMLRSTASITMVGRTEIDVRDRMNAALFRGAAEFHCPPAAVGFTVHLPDGARIVDLGTRFFVQIDDHGVAVVRNLEGRIRIETPDEQIVLGAGDARWVRDGAVKDFTDAVADHDPTVDLRFDLPGEPVVLGSIGSGRMNLHGAFERIDSDAGRHLAFEGGYATVDDQGKREPIGNRLTVAAWVRLNSRDRQAIVHDCLGTPSYSLEVYEQKPAFVVSFKGQRKGLHVGADQPMPVDRWVLLVGVYDGKTVSLYLDGQRVAQQSAPRRDLDITPSSGPFYVGRRSDRDADPVDGAIRRVAIFHSALTPEQVSALNPITPAPFRSSSPSSPRPTDAEH